MESLDSDVQDKIEKEAKKSVCYKLIEIANDLWEPQETGQLILLIAQALQFSNKKLLKFLSSCDGDEIKFTAPILSTLEDEGLELTTSFKLHCLKSHMTSMNRFLHEFDCYLEEGLFQLTNIETLQEVIKNYTFLQWMLASVNFANLLVDYISWQ